VSSLGRVWYIYLLQCADGTLYTGISLDPTRRVQAHNAGRGGRYTRTRRPVVLLASKCVGAQREALALEKCIKKRSPTQKRKTFGI
jgi:predicted GIY-YIG superfamily endonuclease